MFAMTSSIKAKGIGRRFANIICKKADIDMNKTTQELDSIMTIVANPRQFKVPDWFLNMQKDYKDEKYSQVVLVSNALHLERLKKIRKHKHRGLNLRH